MAPDITSNPENNDKSIEVEEETKAE